MNREKSPDIWLFKVRCMFVIISADTSLWNKITTKEDMLMSKYTLRLRGQFFFYWSKIALQCCVSFCCTMKWISFMYTFNPSLLDLPPTPPPSSKCNLRWISKATFKAEHLLYIAANLEGFSSSWHVFSEDTFNLMTLAFIWQGEPGSSGVDGAPGKDGPRVSTWIGEKQNLSVCDME